jgi:hypothetical protein
VHPWTTTLIQKKFPFIHFMQLRPPSNKTNPASSAEVFMHCKNRKAIPLEQSYDILGGDLPVNVPNLID